MAWVLESAKVVRAKRTASKVVVVGGFGLHSPCTSDRRFYSGRIISCRRASGSLIMLSEDADGQRFKGTAV